ncbi:MAG: cobalamin biosynthesis protein [Bilophila sp.]
MGQAERAVSTIRHLCGAARRRPQLAPGAAVPALHRAGFAIIPGLRHGDILRVGWRDRHAHESPNSAWSEAAFAGALGLRLGGPAVYGDFPVEHPWLGDGTPDALPAHIVLAVRLMRHAVVVFTLCEVFAVGMVGVTGVVGGDVRTGGGEREPFWRKVPSPLPGPPSSLPPKTFDWWGSGAQGVRSGGWRMVLEDWGREKDGRERYRAGTSSS